MLSETIELNAQPIAFEKWNVSPVRGAAAVRLMLDSGESAALFVEVHARQTVALSLQPGVAAVLIEIPLPFDGSVLQDLTAAKSYLEKSRQIVWRQHPAGETLAFSTLKLLSQRAQALHRERAVLARLGASRDHGQRADTVGDQAEAAVVAPTETDNPQWIDWRKPKSSFIFYAGRGGNGWLLLQHRDGGQVVVPWPVEIEGWDEALPPKIGTPDLELGGYRVVHEVNTMVYLGSISAGVRNVSTWSELLRQRKG